MKFQIMKKNYMRDLRWKDLRPKNWAAQYISTSQDIQAFQKGHRYLLLLNYLGSRYTIYEQVPHLLISLVFNFQYEKDHNIGVLIGPSKKLVITLITLIGIIMLLGCAGIVYIGYCFLGTTVDAPGKNINPWIIWQPIFFFK